MLLHLIYLYNKYVAKVTKQNMNPSTDLVLEVHTAQKKRDESVMNRIRVANQERDEAIKRLRQLERRLDDQ